MLTVILGLLVLNLLVVVHEFGHFWVARRLGVRVERFSIGIGPILLSRWVDGVQFAISAFPIGGYVKMGGDDPTQRESLQPGDLFAAAPWRRIAIALAGPGANFVFALVVSILLLWIGVRLPDAPNRLGTVEAESPAAAAGFRTGDELAAVNGVATPTLRAVFAQIPGEEAVATEDVVFHVERSEGARDIAVPPDRLEEVLAGFRFPLPAEVGEVVPNSPAYRVGIMKGDRITAVDGTPVSDFSELQAIVERHPEEEIELTIERGENTLQIPITPRTDGEGENAVGRIGIQAASAGTYTVRLGLGEAILQGPQSAIGAVGLMAKQFLLLVRQPSKIGQISGPVAIVKASGDAAQAGIDRLLDLAIMLSIALMVFNLLPIPILDGGMVFLTLVEVVRGQPVGKRGLALYQGIGLAVMGSLIIFVLIHDPLQMILRQNAIGRSGGLSP